MNKTNAIRRAGGSPVLDVRYVQFSNINVAKDVWWIDVPLSRLSDGDLSQVDLLVFDERSDELHHLVVPTSFLREQVGRLTVREEKRCIRLELNANGPHRFRNVKPISSEVDFDRFVKRTV